jgi:hypothetical protein
MAQRSGPVNLNWPNVEYGRGHTYRLVCLALAADFDNATWQDDAAAFLETCHEMKLAAALDPCRSYGFDIKERVKEAGGTSVCPLAGIELWLSTENLQKSVGPGQEKLNLASAFDACCERQLRQCEPKSDTLTTLGQPWRWNRQVVPNGSVAAAPAGRCGRKRQWMVAKGFRKGDSEL